MPSTSSNHSASEASEANFIKKLQAEAKLQAKLEQQRVLPSQLDVITSIIGRYSWQVLVILSGLTAVSLELVKVWL